MQIDIADQQSIVKVDHERLCEAVRVVTEQAGATDGVVSVAIVDNPTIHELNRQYLAHDYPTDVLSFVLESRDGWLEGEIIASAEFAASTAEQYGWRPADELLLYVVHGALHLVGCDDTTHAAAEAMRRRERDVLAQFGLEPRYTLGESFR